MTVGVVIPCRNEAGRVADVLDALAIQTRRPDDVVIVDDGSVDGTAGVVDEWRQRHDGLLVRIIPGPMRGAGAAVNAGVAALTTDVVVRLDGHCRPAADYIARATALITGPDVGVVGGVWVVEPGGPSRQAEAIAIAAAHPLGSGGAAYRSATFSEPADVDTVPFGCFRRALWSDLGGLNEGLGVHEDYEFNYRVRRRGLRVVLDPHIRCEYYARATLAALARQYARYGWWKARMLMRYPRATRWRQVVPALLVPGLLVVLVAVARSGGVWPLLLAVYPTALAVGAIHAAATRGKWPAAGWLAGALLTMQVAWSAAFWLSVVSVGLPRGQGRS